MYIYLQEDVCGPNPLDGYFHVEELAQEEEALVITSAVRNQILKAWNNLKEHDRSPTKFRSAYESRWGNTMFGRTKGEPGEAALMQKLKFAKRFSPAQAMDSVKNRLVYCVIKQLWLCDDLRKKKITSKDLIMTR